MNPWLEHFRQPSGLADQSAGHWFARIADLLLNHTRWVVAGHAHRLTEIEFYYRSPAHDDPFPHADPIQVHAGRWYFHKTGGVYRGGSFKGLDITFGDGQARGGILIRGVQTATGRLIDGPSLLVDHVLTLCQEHTVAALDHRIGGRLAWDEANPLHLSAAPPAGKCVLACARVGLSLRKTRPGSNAALFLTRPYRFLAEPTAIRKGKVQMVLGLYRLGLRPGEICRRTASPARTVAAYLAEYETGRMEGEFEDYFGRTLGPRDLCRLHGIADRLSPPVSAAPPPHTP